MGLHRQFWAAKLAMKILTKLKIKNRNFQFLILSSALIAFVSPAFRTASASSGTCRPSYTTRVQAPSPHSSRTFPDCLATLLFTYSGRSAAVTTATTMPVPASSTIYANRSDNGSGLGKERILGEHGRMKVLSGWLGVRAALA